MADLNKRALRLGLKRTKIDEPQPEKKLKINFSKEKLKMTVENNNKRTVNFCET